MPSTYPSLVAETTSWTRVSNTMTFTSPSTKATQTLGLSASLWSASLTYNTLQESEFNTLNGFIMSLRGRAGRFYLSPPQYPKTEFSDALTATTSGTTVTLSSGESTLDVGHYLSINSELKMIISKTSDTIYTVDEPFSQVYTAQAIKLNAPECIMMLSDDNFKMDYRPPLFSGATINCIEALT